MAGKKRTKEQFIDKALKVHGKRYDYSMVKYRGSTAPIDIVCRVHGKFKQLPKNHCEGKGCPECGKISYTRKQKLTTTEFIRRSLKVHNGKYTYDDVKISHSNTKVPIECKKHGIFLQSPSMHMRGHGCMECRYESNTAITKTGFIELAEKNKCSRLYLIRCFLGEESFYKIGITTKSINERFRSTSIPYRYEIVVDFSLLDPAAIFDIESRVKTENRHLKYDTKVKFNGHTECFREDDSLVASVLKNIEEIVNA